MGIMQPITKDDLILYAIVELTCECGATLKDDNTRFDPYVWDFDGLLKEVVEDAKEWKVIDDQVTCPKCVKDANVS